VKASISGDGRGGAGEEDHGEGALDQREDIERRGAADAGGEEDSGEEEGSGAQRGVGGHDPGAGEAVEQPAGDEAAGDEGAGEADHQQAHGLGRAGVDVDAPYQGGADEFIGQHGEQQAQPEAAEAGVAEEGAIGVHGG
jgi:hypothetical protein